MIPVLLILEFFATRLRSLESGVPMLRNILKVNLVSPTTLGTRTAAPEVKRLWKAEDALGDALRFQVLSTRSFARFV